MNSASRLLFCSLAAALVCLTACGPAIAQSPVAPAESANTRAQSPQLQGLSLSEAQSLIGKLQELQEKLRKQEPTYFDLLSGANPSFKAASISPRQTFLDMAFEKPFSVERVATQNRLWQPFRLTYLIAGEPRTIWEVEVVLGIHGQVERVQMLNKPPAPF